MIDDDDEVPSTLRKWRKYFHQKMGTWHRLCCSLDDWRCRWGSFSTLFFSKSVITYQMSPSMYFTKNLSFAFNDSASRLGPGARFLLP
jgi:hypothetical protein